MNDRWIKVDGISIKLTPQQLAEIEKGKRRRERCRNSFHKMLLHFGFKHHSTFEGNPCDFYLHTYYNWFAEITVHNEHWADVFMAGEELKSTGFPGGYTYGTPEGIETELLRALKILESKLPDK